MSEGKLGSMSLWAQSSPFTGTGTMLPVASMGGAASWWALGWHALGWEDVANFQGILCAGVPLSPSLLSLQGSRGPKGYKVSKAVGTCVLPHGWVLSDLRLTLWSLPLTGREGQAWH